ncbi:hypothetical protein [Cellulomonas sp. URHB0016]
MLAELIAADVALRPLPRRIAAVPDEHGAPQPATGPERRRDPLSVRLRELA